MAIFQLQANLPVLINSFKRVVTIYVRQYGAGNLRLSFNKEDLLNTAPNVSPGNVVDGIPQAAAAGIQQYFWSGDLWVISDVAGPAMILAPAQRFYIDRGIRNSSPADVDNAIPGDDLSTYR